MKVFLTILSFFFALTLSAQKYTFECVTSAGLHGDSCDVCPTNQIEYRSFNGLLIYRDSVPYKWIDQPYSIRQRPGEILEYWEHTRAPEHTFAPEKIAIALWQTNFLTVEGMRDSTFCTGIAPEYRNPRLFAANGPDTSGYYIALGPDNGAVLLKGGVDINLDRISDTIVINSTASGGGGSGTVTSVDATQPAAGFTITGGPITVSGTFVFALANDLAALEGLSSTGISARTATDTWALRTITAGTAISVSNGNGVSGNPTITNTAPDQTVVLNSGTGISVTGTYPTFTITNSSPDQTVSLTGAGISVVTGTYPSFTVTSTEVDGSISNEGSLSVLAGTGTTSLIHSNTSGSTDVTIEAGTGLSISENTGTGTIKLATTITQYTDEQAQDAVGNILTDSGTIDFTYNDAGNTITAIVIDNSISDSKIRQSSGLSVIGRSATTTGNVADITGTTDQVLRVNTAGTSLGFGTVATGGITNQAVTYAKMQNMATNRFLGRITAGSGSPEELTGTQATTLLDVFTSTLKGLAPASGGGTTNFLRADGTWAAPTISLSGTANRFALWTATNTLGDDAAFTFDGANDRATFTGSVAGTGANNAWLNLNGGSITGTAEALRASANLSTSLDVVIANARNVSNTGSVKLELQVGGTSAADPYMLFSIPSGSNTAVGNDNSDADKFKITPGGTAPGSTANKGITVTQDATTLVGVNLDAPVEEMDVAGEVRARHLLNTGNLWNNGLCAFGAGAGTAPTINGLSGGNNFFLFEFTTGTLPVNNGIIATLTFPNAYPVGPTYTVFSPRNNQTATDIAKFYINSSSDTAITFQANGTLNASTAYKFFFITGGRE